MMKIASFLLAALVLLAACSQSSPSVQTEPQAQAASGANTAAPAGPVTEHGYPIEQNPGPGPYVGTAIGYPEYMGTVTVTMEVADGVITAISVEGPDETPGYGSRAVDELGPDMYEANSIVVDVISGATASSQGILHAAEKALGKAGLTNADLKKIAPREYPREPAPEAPVDELFGASSLE